MLTWLPHPDNAKWWKIAYHDNQPFASWTISSDPEDWHLELTVLLNSDTPYTIRFPINFELPINDATFLACEMAKMCAETIFQKLKDTQI